MQLYFIRHAQSENNLLFTQTGSMSGRTPDPELSLTGREQVKALAGFLKQQTSARSSHATGHNPQNVHGFAITHLYCSLMVRSVATGTAVAAALGLPLVAWEDLHESGGIYRTIEPTGERIGLPGRNRAYFEQNYPELILPDSLRTEGWWNRPYEAREHRPRRARRFLRVMHHRHGGSQDRVAVISHGGFYNQFMRALLDLPDDRALWFSMSNAAITRIDFDDDETWVAYMNRLEFMPRDLVT